MTAILLNTRCSKEVKMVLVPENLRHKYRDFKYILDLKKEIKEKLFEDTKKTENGS